MRFVLFLPLILSIGIVLTCRDKDESARDSQTLSVEGLYRDPLAEEPTVLELRQGGELVARLTLPPGYLQDNTRVRLWLDQVDPYVESIFETQRLPTVSVEFINRFGKIASIFGEASLELAVPEPMIGLVQSPGVEWTAIYSTAPGTGLSGRMFAPGEARKSDNLIRVPVFGAGKITVGRFSATALQNRPPLPSGDGFAPYIPLLADDSTQSETIPRCLPSVYGSVQPANGDIEVDLDRAITIVFTVDIDVASLQSALKVENAATGAAIPGTIAYNNGTRTLSFTPSGDYPQNTQIQYRIATGLKLADGTPVTTGQIARFTTLQRSRLLAHWRFDNNGADSSGNGKTATENGGLTYSASDRIQGSHSAVFNGTNAAFNIGAFDFGSTFTVTVWVNLFDPLPPGLRTILANGVGGKSASGFKFFINTFEPPIPNGSDRSVAMEAGNASGGALRKTPNNFVSTGSWKHIAFIIDKTAALGQRALLYFNGQKASPLTDYLEGTATVFPNNFATSGQTAYIGRFPTAQDPNATYFFYGKMDDFRIYNTILTDSEIAQIATQQ